MSTSPTPDQLKQVSAKTKELLDLCVKYNMAVVVNTAFPGSEPDSVNVNPCFAGDIYFVAYATHELSRVISLQIAPDFEG